MARPCRSASGRPAKAITDARVLRSRCNGPIRPVTVTTAETAAVEAPPHATSSNRIRETTNHLRPTTSRPPSPQLVAALLEEHVTVAEADRRDPSLSIREELDKPSRTAA